MNTPAGRSAKRSAETAVNLALAAADDALAEVAALARSDRRAALHQATRLLDLGAARDAAGQLRNTLAGEIYEADALSLAGLARIGGFSKGRAGQLVRAYKAGQQPQEDRP
jgi:hypothetical protein